MKAKDQLHRSIELKNIPKRIVSLVPSQTELLYDLGLESSIVGITKFCVHPMHLKKEKTSVGGTKEVNFKKIAALKPDIILCNKEENTLEMIKQLEFIAPVHISDIYTIEDCLELIKMYGRLFHVEEKALTISEAIQIKLEEFKAFISNKPKLKTAYFIWKKPWMVAAKSTFIDELLALNNFENYYSNLDRYPEIVLKTNETINLVLLSSEPYPFKEKHIEELGLFFPKAKILLVDGEAFSWYGSRLIKALDYFKQLHQNQ
jgi:iron complex transport system substrate-binding protein